MEHEITQSKDSSPTRIASSRFGDLVITREYIWDFPEGLIGLKTHKRFALISTNDGDDTLFLWLHSVTNGNVALPVMNPLRVFPDYIIRQDEPEIISLGLHNEKEVQVLVIVTVPPGDPEGITANLAAPLIMIPEKRIGWQVILEKGIYRVAQPLFAFKDKKALEGENIISVGSVSPPVSIINDPTRENHSQFIKTAHGRAEEVMPPPDSIG